MLDKSFLDRVVEIGSPKHETIDGVKFYGGNQLKFNIPSTLKVFSLTQIASVIKASGEDELIVNVDSFDCVSVLSRDLNKNGVQTVIAEADFSDLVEKFSFSSPMNQEEFVIKLLSLFDRTDEREDLIRTVLSVKAEKISTSDDDGYSQVVATKAGVHLSAEKRLVNLWNLKAFRTFPEVKQPTIPFILRLHQRDSETPRFALYPCDGGKWQVELTIAIREWLLREVGNMATVTVL